MNPKADDMKAYKAFNNDWTCNGFQYEIGKTYKHDGNIKTCNSGFHACKKPVDVFNYYPCVPWSKFAEVQLSGNILGKDEDKQCASEITIVKEIDFYKFIDLCKSKGVNESEGVNWSEGVNRSEGVNGSEGVNRSEGVNGSEGVNWSEGVNRSEGVNKSQGVNGSYGVNWSKGVNGSYGVNWSEGVNRSEDVNWSKGVNKSQGVNGSYGVNVSIGVNGSDGVNNSLFVHDIKRPPLLFNKEVAPERINEVKNRYNELVGDWYPEFNNLKSLYLKSGNEWKRTPIPNAEEISKKEAWSGMPKQAIDYLKSLPEFDADVFEGVTGIKIK